MCRNEADAFVENVTGRHRVGVSTNEIAGGTTMNQAVIEAQARYLIRDRVKTAALVPPCRVRRRRRRLRTLSRR